MASKSGWIRFVLTAALGLTASNASAQNAGWVAAWGASQQNLGEAKISNASPVCFTRDLNAFRSQVHSQCLNVIGLKRDVV